MASGMPDGCPREYPQGFGACVRGTDARRPGCGTTRYADTGCAEGTGTGGKGARHTRSGRPMAECPARAGCTRSLAHGSLTARSRLAHGAFGCLSAVYQVAARQSSLSICVSACVLASTCRHHRTATAHTGQHAPGHRRTRACTWGASVGRVLGQVHGARTHRVVVCLEDEIVATVVQMVLL